MIDLGSTPQNAWKISPAHVDLRRTDPPPQPLMLPAAPQNLTLDLARTAIVVIDMQNDFCTPGGWLAHIGVDVTPTHRATAGLLPLLPKLRTAGVPVIWLNWGNRPDRLNLSPALLHVYNPDGTSTGLGDALPHSPAVLEKSSWGAAIIDALPIDPADIQIDKFRMSGFWDTPLDSILRNLRTTTLLFAGVNADQCVMATLQDANFLGYDTILLEDCTATTSPGFCWNATLYNVRQCFGFTLVGADLIAALNQRPTGEPA